MNKGIVDFYIRNEKLSIAIALLMALGLFLFGILIGQASSPTIVKVQCQQGTQGQSVTLTGFFDYVMTLEFPPIIWFVIILFLIIIIK